MGQPDSIFDLVDEDRKAQAIAEAEADIRTGRVVEHAVVVDWLLRAADALENGRPMPPPPLPESSPGH